MSPVGEHAEGSRWNNGDSDGDEEDRKMKILVTGGAGYIGSIVVERLLQAGVTPVVYDNLSKGHREAVAPGAVLIVGDLADRDHLVKTLREFDCQAVIHLAALSLVGESVAQPHLYFQHNVAGGIQLLEAMREARVDQLVFSSTAAVYGVPATIPITEDAPTCPTNPYGESKLAFERMLPWYEQAYGIRSIRLRYFNAAGASERCGEDHTPETHLIPNVLRVAAGVEPAVSIFGEDYATPDGTCVRDYIHVEDLARGYVRLAEEAERFAGQSFNFGSSPPIQIRALVDRLVEVAGFTDQLPPRVLLAPCPDRKVDAQILSTEKARTLLGWEAQISLDVGLAATWTWYRDHLASLGPFLVPSHGPAHQS